MAKAKKSLGQHFLTNPHTALNIADAVNADAKTIIEVGPGPGILTEHILKRDAALTFIEKDDQFAANLKGKTTSLENVTVLNEDFLKVNLPSITSDPDSVIVGNFPYNISSQIVFRMLEHKDLFSELVGMFQLEMAKRIVSPPKSKEFGVISVLTQASYYGELLFHVPPEQFTPPPKVNSAVIKLTRKEDYELPCDEKWLRTVVKAAFNQRRKMLRNSLKAFFLDQPILDSELFTRRPEQLDVEMFFELANMAKEHSNSDI